MATILETVDGLHQRGEFGEIARISESRELKSPSLDPRVRVTIAHSLAITGAYDSAWRMADAASSSSNAVIRSRALYAMGLVCQSRGSTDSAVGYLRQSLQLAHECSDFECAGWSAVALFRLLNYIRVPNEERLTLADVRRWVAKASSPHVSAYLHISVAALEGQAGRLDEAMRHCDVAESLLTASPNTWLIGNLLLNRASITSLQCDFEKSSHYVREGRALAVKAGDFRSVLMFDNNAAHNETAVGRFDSARRIYNRLLSAPGVTSSTTLAATEGLARLELALGNYESCRGLLNQIEQQLARNPSLLWHYSARWAAVTNARLSVRLSDFAGAKEQLELLLVESRLVRDLPYAAALQILMAEAMCGLGDYSGCAQRIAAAARADILDFKELRAEFYTTSAKTIGESALNGKLLERAARINTQLPVADLDVQRRAHSRLNAEVSADFADSVRAMLDHASTAEVFAAECIGLLRRLGFAAELARVPIDVGGDIQRLTLSLSSDKRPHAIVCDVPQEPLRALLLTDIFRIARAALALERFKQEDRNRAALWPADPIETEAGALFLSDEMKDLLDVARRAASTNIPVLITGETGTGKEVLARLIHAYSPRTKATFLPFNCTATPRDMLDAQLFGHRRGAFTGATESFQGVIRGAAGGTLFLDEIGETSLEVQPKLLRFLESGEVHPIGEAHPTRVDVRVIAATNADLDALVAQGRFREDLLYRLNTVQLRIPPLRERRVEVPALATHYLRKYAAEYGKGELRLSEDTIEYLLLYRWPGNVRQLANEMRRMAALAEKSAVLMPQHLSPDIAASRRTIPASERVLDDTEVVVRTDQPLAAAVGHLERTMIQRALQACGGRLEETATLLGISRKGLYLKRVRYGFDIAADESSAAEVA